MTATESLEALEKVGGEFIYQTHTIFQAAINRISRELLREMYGHYNKIKIYKYRQTFICWDNNKMIVWEK